MNEPSAFLDDTTGTVVLLYVDDCLHDGDESDVTAKAESPGKRFDCKPTEWLLEDNPLDYLGMELLQDTEYTYISMQAYIIRSVETLTALYPRGVLEIKREVLVPSANPSILTALSSTMSLSSSL